MLAFLICSRVMLLFLVLGPPLGTTLVLIKVSVLILSREIMQIGRRFWFRIMRLKQGRKIKKKGQSFQTRSNWVLLVQ